MSDNGYKLQLHFQENIFCAIRYHILYLSEFMIFPWSAVKTFDKNFQDVNMFPCIFSFQNCEISNCVR